MLGVGLPMAVQWNVVSSPSRTVLSIGVEVRLAGTDRLIKKKQQPRYILCRTLGRKQSVLELSSSRGDYKV